MREGVEQLTCSSCGHTQPEGTFCEKCGEALPEGGRQPARACDSCGYEQFAGSFCARCGAPISHWSDPSHRTPWPRSPAARPTNAINPWWIAGAIIAAAVVLFLMIWADRNMSSSAGVLSIELLAPVVATAFYLLMLQKALSRCSPQSRTMSPGLVWLQIIPLAGLVWSFFVVAAVARSYENEFRARGMAGEQKPGYSLGLAMSITQASSVVLLAVDWGITMSTDALALMVPSMAVMVAYVVLWILYWVKVQRLSFVLTAGRPVSAGVPFGASDRPQPPVSSPTGTPAVQTPLSIADELSRLAELLDRRLLTTGEFERAKERLLGGAPSNYDSEVPR
jgi:hypothetical protein